MSWRNGNGKLRKDQTDPYGRIHEEVTPFIENFEDSDTIKFSQSALGKVSADLQDEVKEVINNALTDEDIKSSEEIIKSVDETDNKIKFNLDNDLSNKINNSLQIPLSTPTSTELVGIGTDKSQKRILIGSQFKIDENTLLYDNVIDTGIKFETMPQPGTPVTIYLSGTIGNKIADMIKAGIKNIKLLFREKHTTEVYDPIYLIGDVTGIIQNPSTPISYNITFILYRTYHYSPTPGVIYKGSLNALGINSSPTGNLSVILPNSLSGQLNDNKIKELENKYNVLNEQYINVLQEINKLKEGGH